MNRKILVMFMTSCVLAFSAGCTSQESAPVDPGYEEIAPEFATNENEAQAAPEQETAEEKTEATAETSQSTTDETSQSAASDISDGKWSAYLDSSRKDVAGKVGEAGEPQAIIYDGGVEGDQLTIVGVLAPDPYDPTGYTQDGAHVLKLDDSTSYIMSGGDEGPETVTKEEFGGYFKNCLNSGGLAFDIEVQGGVVKEVKISA